MNTDMKIYEIAELVGYSDWHYLYSVYKKQLGHSMSKKEEKRTHKMVLSPLFFRLLLQFGSSVIDGLNL